MEIIVCLDNSKGMLFNNRRQSRDAKVLEDIKNDLKSTLTIYPFSEKLVSGAEIPYELISFPLSSDTVLFIEDRGIKDFLPQARRITLYLWNRDYPADTYLDVDLWEEGFRLASTADFEGTSHEKITKEVYER